MNQCALALLLVLISISHCQTVLDLSMWVMVPPTVNRVFPPSPHRHAHRPTKGDSPSLRHRPTNKDILYWDIDQPVWTILHWDTDQRTQTTLHRSAQRPTNENKPSLRHRPPNVDNPSLRHRTTNEDNPSLRLSSKVILDPTDFTTKASHNIFFLSRIKLSSLIY